jgi:hypothetical protein
MPTYANKKQEKLHILTSQCRKRESATNSTNKKREKQHILIGQRVSGSGKYRILSINVAGFRIKGDL